MEGKDVDRHRETISIVIALLVIGGLVCLGTGHYIVLLILWGIGALLYKRAKSLGVEPRDTTSSSR